ncbi:hypothetical protein TIFTF001_054265, partial [Ficus carica]
MMSLTLVPGSSVLASIRNDQCLGVQVKIGIWDGGRGWVSGQGSRSGFGTRVGVGVGFRDDGKVEFKAVVRIGFLDGGRGRILGYRIGVGFGFHGRVLKR